MGVPVGEDVAPPVAVGCASKSVTSEARTYCVPCFFSETVVSTHFPVTVSYTDWVLVVV